MRLLPKVTVAFFFMIADSSAPSGVSHPHTGRVAPFLPGDPKISLDGKALAILKDGKPYQTLIENDDKSSGRGLVVQDVHAPTSIVWERILDYPQYPKMVPNTLESENYRIVKNGRKGAQSIFTRMKIGFPLIKIQFFVKHEYIPEKKSLTWTLDYSRKSDLDDSCGFWYVVEHPDNPNWTRVYYSVEVMLFDWVPNFVVNFMKTKALTDATAWVKKFSELEANKRGVATEVSSSVPSDTKSAGWLQRLGRGRKESLGDGDDSTCAETVDSECTNPAEVVPLERVGVRRYALVISVFALSLYNVHLYFSQ